MNSYSLINMTHNIINSTTPPSITDNPRTILVDAVMILYIPKANRNTPSNRNLSTTIFNISNSSCLVKCFFMNNHLLNKLMIMKINIDKKNLKFIRFLPINP